MTTLVHAVGKVAEWSGMSHLCAEIAKHAPDWVKRGGEQIKCDVQWIARRVEPLHTGPLGWVQHKEWQECLKAVEKCLEGLGTESLETTEVQGRSLVQLQEELKKVWGAEQTPPAVSSQEDENYVNNVADVYLIAQRWSDLPGAPEWEVLQGVIEKWESQPSAPSEQKLENLAKGWKSLIGDSEAEKVRTIDYAVNTYRQRSAALNLPLSEAHSCAQRVALLALGLMWLQIIQS